MQLLEKFMLKYRSVIFAMLILASFSNAYAQFVPVPSDENSDGATTPPNLKVLKTIPSAPFEDLNGLQTPEETASGKTARVRIKEIDDAAWLPFGAFQRGQYLKAMELALSRAQLRDPAAQTLIAELFAEGFGVGRSMDDAVFWYDQAAKNGDPAAQYKLALLLTDGRYIERNDDRARELMKQSAEAGNAKAQFNFAQLLVAEKPGPVGIREALPFFEKSAARGIPDAQYALSQIYINALDVDDAKRAIARRHLIAAARAGYDTARLDLAIWLIDGVGGDRDFEAGFEWMSLAALKGNVIAQNRLAHLYIQAIGTRGNPIEAGKWYIISRRAGLEDASLEDFYQGLTVEEQKASLAAANELRF
ncbi:MAG: sel1 repeat family protein [Rhizobiaceae bacterium]|nr:sel1 repeat family protein [Rhizobiaceae bacterium]